MRKIYTLVKERNNMDELEIIAITNDIVLWLEDYNKHREIKKSIHSFYYEDVLVYDY